MHLRKNFRHCNRNVLSPAAVAAAAKRASSRRQERELLQNSRLASERRNTATVAGEIRGARESGGDARVRERSG